MTDLSVSFSQGRVNCVIMRVAADVDLRPAGESHKYLTPYILNDESRVNFVRIVYCIIFTTFFFPLLSLKKQECPSDVITTYYIIRS